MSRLFSGHPALIQGFNTFLPAGYRIECSSDPQQSTFITVTTPSGTVFQSTHEDLPGPSGTSQWSVLSHLDGPGESSSSTGVPQAHTLAADPITYGLNMDTVSIEPAVQYVQKIKQRCDEATYRRFLEILGRYHNMADAVDEVSRNSHFPLQLPSFLYLPSGRFLPKLLGSSKMTRTYGLISGYSCQRRAKHFLTKSRKIFLRFPLRGARDQAHL